MERRVVITGLGAISPIGNNVKDFFKRVFGVVLSVGIIVWVLTHTQFNLCYTGDISKSILFIIASYIKFIFAPIGLNHEGVVCALIVGVLAKELIVSTLSVINNSNSTAELISSLTLTTSTVCFGLPSAIVFLIFSSMYSPCVSNLAVLKKETDTLTMWFALVSQFTIAYMLCFVVYQTIVKGWLYMAITMLIIFAILFSAMFIIKKVKHAKCLTCCKCK